VRFCVLRFFHNYFVGLFFAIRCLWPHKQQKTTHRST
jgi:hypothetical protein